MVTGKGTSREVTFAAPTGWARKAAAASGVTASMPGVAAGASVSVQARRTGFESLVSLANPSAVAAAVASTGPAAGRVAVSFPIRTKGLTAKAEGDGSVSFVDSKGAVVSRIVPAQAWDAATDARSGLPSNVTPARLDVVQQGKGHALLIVSVDKAWAGAAGRVFPVTIDPTYATGSTVAPSLDTWVQTGVTTDESADAELRVGTYDSGAHVARSFLDFPTTAVSGKKIMSASLSVYEHWAWSCTPAKMNAYVSGYASSATRWTAQPTIYSATGGVTVAKGPTGCASGRVNIDVTGAVTTAVANSWANVSIALKADNESDSYGWKRFDSLEGANDPYVSFTYDRAPNTASAATFVSSGTYGGVGYVQGARVTFTATATDPDASQVKELVEVHNSTTTSSTSLVASCTTGLVASGASASCVNGTDLPDGGTYYVRAKAIDDQGVNAAAWSGWTTIKRAATAPGSPAISCPGYPNGSWSATSPTANVSCTVSTSGSGVKAATRLRVYLDGSTTPAADVDAKQAATSVTVSVPKAAGGHSVKAVAVGGSNLSSTTTSSFGWGAASMLTPVNHGTTSGKVKVSASGSGSNVTSTAQVQWRVAGDTTWTNGPTIPVTVTNGVATASGTVDTTTLTKDASGYALPARTPVLLDLQVCFSFTAGSTQCTFVQSPTSITRLPHAFGSGFPTKDVGVGQVAQFTGEFATSSTDVSVPGMSGGLSIDRSHLSFNGDGSLTGWPSDVASSIFGPGWTANLTGPDAGTAGMQVIDNTTVDGTIVLADGDGTVLVFRQPGGARTKDKAGTYAAVTQDTIDDGSSLIMNSTGTSITVTEPDGTVTTYTPTTGTSTVPVQWGAASVAEPAANGTTTYTRDSTSRPTRITSGLPDGYTSTDCPATGAGKPGCRSLNLTYTSGRVTQISTTLWDPATQAMTSTTMATYAYDSAGRMTSATDARTGLVNGYGWDGTSTRLASITPPGQAAWRFTYDSSGRMSTISRDGATSGAPAARQATFVYTIPMGTSAPATLPPVDAATIATWSQDSAPTQGFAMFGPDRPGVDPAHVTDTDWHYGDLSYTDSQGYEVNTATFGAGHWLLTATDYDERGNVIRTLDPTAIDYLQAEKNAGTTPSPDEANFHSTQTVYNTDITDASGAVTVPAGTRVVDTYGPAAQVTVPSGTVLTARAHVHTQYDQGAPNNGINPATGVPYGLPTTVTTTVNDSTTGSDVVLGTTTNSYAPVVAGDGDGWALGAPVTVTSGGITRVTRFDTAGRTIETRAPAATGSSHPLSTRTVYYTAGANGVDSSCGGTAQSAAWAGSVCAVIPGASPSAGPGLLSTRTTYNRWLSPATVTETAGSVTRTTTTTYDPQGRPSRVAVTSNLAGAVPRPATLMTYDPATGAVASVAAEGSSTPITTSRDRWGRVTGYANDQGEVTATSYNAAGQVASVTDPTGTTRYAYDGTDAAGNEEHRGLATGMSITRAGTGGDLAYAGAYDAAGTLVRDDLPGKVTQVITTNALTQPVGLSYTGQVTPVTATTDPATGGLSWTAGTPTTGTWAAWTMDRDAQGRIVHEYTGDGAAFDGTTPAPATAGATDTATVGAGQAYDRSFTYDQAGRLTTVTDRTATVAMGSLTPDTAASGLAPCQVRSYGFNADGARTSSGVENHSDGDCASTVAGTVTTATTAYHLDNADRFTTAATTVDGSTGAGYAYDGLGRQTTIPAADTPAGSGAGDLTLGYYVDDLPRSVSQHGVTSTFGLDAAGRRATQAVTGGADDGTTITGHYTDDSDNPGWETTTGATGAAPGTDTVTRFTDSLDGGLGAMITGTGEATIPLVDPHGNNVTSITIPAAAATTQACTGIDAWNSYTEYGTPSAGTTPSGTVTGPLGYGWLGTHQRATGPDTAGLTLMGVRYYNPVTGAFTSPDPIPGGNNTSYGYPGDPINTNDLTGQCSWWGCVKSAAGWVGHQIVKHYRTIDSGIRFGCNFAWGAVSVACTAYSVTSDIYYYRSSRRAKYDLAAGLAGSIVGYGAGRGIIRLAGGVGSISKRVVSFSGGQHGNVVAAAVSSAYRPQTRRNGSSVRRSYARFDRNAW